MWHSETWRTRGGTPTPPVKAYLDHLAEISERDPVLLVAHAYTQQRALLAGGQRISKFIRSTLPKVDGDEGVSVFAFKVRPDFSESTLSLNPGLLKLGIGSIYWL